MFHPVRQAKPHLHDLLFPGAKPVYSLAEHVFFSVLFQLCTDLVLVAAQHVREQELIAVAVRVQGLVDAGFLAAVAAFAQIHQNLVFDAAAGIGGKLDVFGGGEGVHRLDQANGADGDDILYRDAAALELAGNVDHQAQVMGDQDIAAALPALFQPLEHELFFGRGKGRGQGVGPVDIIGGTGHAQPRKGAPCQQPQPGQPSFVHVDFLLFVSLCKNSLPNSAWNCPSRRDWSVNTTVAPSPP